VNPKSIVALTPIALAMMGTVISLTAIATNRLTPEIMATTGLAFTGAAGLARGSEKVDN
jgi:hypothetical protein